MKRHAKIAAFIAGIMLCMACSANDAEYADIPKKPGNVTFAERWSSSENLQITINQQDTAPITLTSGHRDFKPAWSQTGDMLTFFRFVSKGRGFHTWRTKICVINTDGTGF